MKTLTLLAFLAADAPTPKAALSQEERLTVSRAQTLVALTQKAKLDAEKKEAEAISAYGQMLAKLFEKFKLDPSKCDIDLSQEIRCAEPPK